MKKLLIALLLLTASYAHAEELKGTVTKVIDGDTIWIDGSTKIRFNWIDAPELKQPYGKESKEFLSQLVMNREVKAVCEKKDRYGRPVCIVLIDNVMVNKEMVKTGNAWCYKNYSTTEIAEMEFTAREKKIGLWGDPSPCPPWDFRKKLCK
jgi:endonuclease YncB( thermonuclease family)